jgi:hypothetical protein
VRSCSAVIPGALDYLFFITNAIIIIRSAMNPSTTLSLPATTTTEAGDVVSLTYDRLDEQQLLESVRDSKAGAICSFVGTTRDDFQGSYRWDFPIFDV